MTALEIQNTGINESSAFQVTLNNGSIIRFKADLPGDLFYTFHFESNTLSAYKYYDAKGLQNKHIGIKGQDIASIQVTRSITELRESTDKSNATMNVVVVIILLIGFLMFLNKHWH